MASVFRETLGFFYELGIYDVVLPFLLVFTIVFAILEKTRIFGEEKVDDAKYTKKNLNAMVAFVTAFLVVGSARLVAVINEAIANTMVLLVLSIFFLILAGSFHGDKVFSLENNWNKFFMVLMFVGIVMIFLDALGWLQYAYNSVLIGWDSVQVSSIMLLIVVIGLMVWITRSPAGSKEES